MRRPPYPYPSPHARLIRTARTVRPTRTACLMRTARTLDRESRTTLC